MQQFQTRATVEGNSGKSKKWYHWMRECQEFSAHCARWRTAWYIRI